MPPKIHLTPYALSLFAKAINAVLDMEGLSQRAAAAAWGVGRSTVTNAATGKALGRDMYKRLMEETGLDRTAFGSVLPAALGSETAARSMVLLGDLPEEQASIALRVVEALRSAATRREDEEREDRLVRRLADLAREVPTPEFRNGVPFIWHRPNGNWALHPPLEATEVWGNLEEATTLSGLAAKWISQDGAAAEIPVLIDRGDGSDPSISLLRNIAKG